ncbi:DEAD/DEAH box helicase [Nitratireductor sp. XY-223]|uniref:DEAD/DEAH box helicase n=1 Tax=Nitratireductor sp. XY-223 TaxID=2561926 RepID=UPI0019823A7D|nr:DEAD/DEAH box helicase [Nitratireductor sp. XY-223]
MSEWVLDGNVLKLRADDAEIVPTADQVYSSVVENTPAWPDLESGMSGDASRLSFSRYPVEVIAIVSDNEDGGLPLVSFEARTQSGNTFSVNQSILDIGHLVADSTWYPIGPASLDALCELIESSEVNSAGEVETLRGLLNLKAAAADGETVIDRTSSDQQSALRFVRRYRDAPAGINATLYPYQTDGWHWLRFILREQVGGLLADEMGLGKTLQVISAIRDPGGDDHLSRVLVVAPGSLLENWRRELEKFAPDLHVHKHQGSRRTGRPADLEGFDAVITSYDTVIRDLSLLNMVSWSVVILDEAQNIKSPEALRTRSVKRLTRGAGLAMTGTPVENRLLDLWSIMDFALPGYLGRIDDFLSAYENDVDAAERLEPLISPLMLRRLVSEVAQDLPERIDIPEIIELSEQEAQEYERIRQLIYEEYGKAASLVSLTKLRQFCAHPLLLPDHDQDHLSAEFTKFYRLMEILEEIILSGEKAIIFTSYTLMADMIASQVQQRFGVFSACLDGRTPIDGRQPLIDQYSAVTGAAVLVLNPKAGGSGLNITAATHVIHYNLEWNPALEDQASARAHRRGQTKPVMVRRLICEGTVEEVVEDRVQRKRQISNAAIVGIKGSDEEYADLVAALERSPIMR